MYLRTAQHDDASFVLEMARLACGLEDRPLVDPQAPEVRALLPLQDAAIIADDDDGRAVGAAWWHIHEPPLLRDANGKALPELVMAVLEAERGKGIGGALVDALAAEAA